MKEKIAKILKELVDKQNELGSNDLLMVASQKLQEYQWWLGLYFDLKEKTKK